MKEANPFSTRFVQPGGIPFQLRNNLAVEDLVEQFLRMPSRIVSLVGPHGSGKSSLLETIRGAMPKSSQDRLYRLVAQSPKSELRAARWKVEADSWNPNTIVFLDGYEQLSWYSKLQLRRSMSLKQCRMLITVHKPVHQVPVLWTTQRTESDDRFVLQFLLRDCLQHPLEASSNQAVSTIDDFQRSSIDFQDAWNHWQKVRILFPTDMRETLMAMYDWWEEKKTARNF